MLYIFLVLPLIGQFSCLKSSKSNEVLRLNSYITKTRVQIAEPSELLVRFLVSSSQQTRRPNLSTHITTLLMNNRSQWPTHILLSKSNPRQCDVHSRFQGSDRGTLSPMITSLYFYILYNYKYPSL